MKREVGKLWGIRQQEVVLVVVGALKAVSKRLDKWLDKLGITIRMGLQQKTALLGTARNDPRDLWPLDMACSFRVMSV